MVDQHSLVFDLYFKLDDIWINYTTVPHWERWSERNTMTIYFVNH